MNAKAILRVLIVIIIIIGGVIIIVIGKKPFPEPECIVCGTNLITMLGIAEVVLGLGALVVQGGVIDKQRNL